MTLKKIYNWCRKRGTRGIRFACATTALRVRIEQILGKRWDMTEAEDREYMCRHAAAMRDYARLKKLGKTWGYHLP